MEWSSGVWFFAACFMSLKSVRMGGLRWNRVLHTGNFAPWELGSEVAARCRIVDECFEAFKLRKGKWVPCTLRVTNTASVHGTHFCLLYTSPSPRD